MSVFQPFQPEEPLNRRRMPQIPVRQVVPNLVTLLALCAGLTSIRMSIEHHFHLAIALIAIAAVLDGLDGRVARLLRSQSRFGAELDSLMDFVNFGVGPAILLYVWALSEVRSLGWIAALVFAICAALRLARFNVSLDGPAKPDWHARFFVGIPAPAGAMVVMLPIYMEFVGFPRGFWTAPLVLVYTLAIGLLMISQFPTFSGKFVGRRVPRDMVLPLFVVGVLVVAFVVAFPWEALTVLTIAYLASLPIAWRAFHRPHREGETLVEPPKAEGS